MRRSAWCCEYYAEWKGDMERRRSSCYELPGAGFILKTSQHCTIFNVKWSCFTLDARKISNHKKTFLQANVLTFKAQAPWSQALTAFLGLSGECLWVHPELKSNKLTAVSQTWATHSPWLPEEMNLLQSPRKPRSPKTQSHKHFHQPQEGPGLGIPQAKCCFPPPSLSHNEFGCRRVTIAFSKHAITYLNACFKWRHVQADALADLQKDMGGKESGINRKIVLFILIWF